MKFPTEEQLQAVLSELRTHALDKSNDENHIEQCDYCQLQAELTKRNQAAGENQVSAIDSIAMDLSQGDQLLTMILATPNVGPNVVSTLSAIGRIAFLVGLKSAGSMQDADKMNELFKD